MKAIIVVAVISLANAAVNVERMIRTCWYYAKFLSGQKDMLLFNSSIELLLEKAEKNEIIGYGRWSYRKVSDCLDIPECRNRVEECFKKAISVYRARCNPFYIFGHLSRKLNECGKLKNPFLSKIFTSLSVIMSTIAVYFLEKILDMVIPEEWFSAIENLLT